MIDNLCPLSNLRSVDDEVWTAKATSPVGSSLITRNDASIYYSDSLCCWVVTGYAEAQQIMLSSCFVHSSPPRWSEVSKAENSPASRIIRKIEANLVTLQNGERHRHQRKAMHKSFSATAIQNHRPLFRELINTFLNEGQSAGRMDLIADLAEPSLKKVMAIVIGLDENDADNFDSWSQKASKINSFGTPHWSNAIELEIDIAMTNMEALLNRLAETRREKPQQDLISHLVSGLDPGTALSADEILINCWILYLTGIRITSYLAAASVYFLLSRPGFLERAQQDEHFIPRLVQETLRYAPSALEPTPRVAVEDFEINGQTICKGDKVRIYFLETNRDPKAYIAPQSFDPDREGPRSQTFYVGPHFCIGAQIATAVAEEICAGVADLNRGVALAVKPTFRRSQNSPVMLGIEELLLTLRSPNFSSAAKSELRNP